MIAARLMRGAICLSRFSHLPPKLGSVCLNPVMLPPGRGRLATKPARTGSTMTVNTMGMVVVPRCRTAVTGVVEESITSGCHAMSSVAKALARLLSASVQRSSIRALRPSIQPSRANSSTNTATRPRNSGFLTDHPISSPMRRRPSGCSAPTASGHANAAPPTRVMNSRRLIRFCPQARGRHPSTSRIGDFAAHRSKIGPRLTAMGLGRVKTKSDLVVTPSGRQIFAFFCSPHDRRAQNSGCGYTAQSFYTARVKRYRAIRRWCRYRSKLGEVMRAQCAYRFRCGAS